ncbi:MAG: PqqD family protein [Acholeplasmataceae bacterium]|nr:MAG: PqqD family protein [Acholeplasmataceae bacterium]
MKIKAHFVLKEVAGKPIVVPVKEEAVNFSGIITLNASGKFLFEQLQEDLGEDALLARMLDKYDIDEETAKSDIEAFIKTLKDHGII